MLMAHEGASTGGQGLLECAKRGEIHRQTMLVFYGENVLQFIGVPGYVEVSTASAFIVLCKNKCHGRLLG